MPLTEEQVRNRIARSRALKAILIADALGRAGCDSATARKLDDAGRRNAESAAMVRRASGDTWDVVYAVMERRETASRADAEDHERGLLGTR